MSTRPQLSPKVSEHKVAEHLGVNVWWLRDDRRGRRLLPFYKIGRLVRYDLIEVEAALARCQRGGQ